MQQQLWGQPASFGRRRRNLALANNIENQARYFRCSRSCRRFFNRRVARGSCDRVAGFSYHVTALVPKFLIPQEFFPAVFSFAHGNNCPRWQFTAAHKIRSLLRRLLLHGLLMVFFRVLAPFY